MAIEALGAGMLVATIVGSGIAAQRLSDDGALVLLINTIATVGILAALIAALGALSGAHLNPAVSLADRLVGGMDTREMLSYMAAQIGGGCAGAIAANVMFELPAVSIAATERSGTGLWFAEALATFGLVVLILATVRSNRRTALPLVVAGYIGAAYWFTASTSFANPAVTAGRALSDTFAGISPADVVPFWICQLVGALAAVGFAITTFGRPRPASDPLPDSEEVR